MLAGFLTALFLLAEAFVLARSLLRPHRDPAARLAWVVVILALPAVGIIAYLLFGETNLGRGRIERMRKVNAALPAPQAPPLDNLQAVPAIYAPLFDVGQSINGHPAVTGNQASLMADSDTTIDNIVADIEAAQHHVHVLFYIWLADDNGLAVVEALKRAAGRGVTCRAKADELGSRRLIRSPHWTAMREAGVELARALPINPLRARMDMRNHRKIVVIDNHITYCGSQNCADPGFAVKARFAPWVDIMLRFEGPVTLQNQRLFAVDWMATTGENLLHLFDQRNTPQHPKPGFTAQVIGSSAAVRFAAIPEIVTALVGAARRELVISTPYYVPDDSIQRALCSAARRGVAVHMIFPARNDSWVVAAASRSYYHELLDAGVRIHEYVGGLLHAKTLTLDGEVAFLGSANLDRRSFDLNAENNLLLHDVDTTSAIRARQTHWLDSAREIHIHEVEAWPRLYRLWNNAVGMASPLL